MANKLLKLNDLKSITAYKAGDIQSIRVAAQSAAESLQKELVKLSLFIIATGDVGTVQKAVSELTSLPRFDKKALTAWCKAFMPVRYDKKKDVWRLDRKLRTELSNDAALEQLQTTNWYDFKEAKTLKEFEPTNVMDVLVKLTKKLKKEQAEHGCDHDRSLAAIDNMLKAII